MRRAVYLCVFLVVLSLSVDGLSIACMGGSGCDETKTESGTTRLARKTGAIRPTTTTTAARPSTTTATTTPTTTVTNRERRITTIWPYRKVICPPGFDEDEALEELYRWLSLDESSGYDPTSNKPTRQIDLPTTKLFQTLFKSSKRHGIEESTSPSTQEFSVPTTTNGQTTNAAPTPSSETSTKSSSTTTKSHHIFAWVLK